MAHMLGLFDGGHAVEDVLTEEAVAERSVDREIAYTEGGEVLEEVGALRGIDMIVLQSGLHDDAGGGYVGPLHRNAQPIVATSPAPWAYQDVGSPTLAAVRSGVFAVEETLVDAFYL